MNINKSRFIIGRPEIDDDVEKKRENAREATLQFFCRRCLSHTNDRWIHLFFSPILLELWPIKSHEMCITGCLRLQPHSQNERNTTIERQQFTWLVTEMECAALSLLFCQYFFSLPVITLVHSEWILHKATDTHSVVFDVNCERAAGQCAALTFRILRTKRKIESHFLLYMCLQSTLWLSTPSMNAFIARCALFSHRTTHTHKKCCANSNLNSTAFSFYSSYIHTVTCPVCSFLFSPFFPFFPPIRR